MHDRQAQKDEKGVGKLARSFRYPAAGIRHAWKGEQNFRIGCCIAAVVILLGVLFHLNIMEWALVVLSIALVLGAELFNTAIESMVDLATKEEHPLAKAAKDTAAAAVLVFVIAAGTIGLLVFLPKVIGLFADFFP